MNIINIKWSNSSENPKLGPSHPNTSRRKSSMNNSFVHLEYSTRHPGVERMARVLRSASVLRQSLDASRGLAGVLLAAMVATLVVVADQLMETWADGHLLAAWVLMWVIGFAALALLAPTARNLAGGVMAGLDGWSQDVARRRADERLWDLARSDSRVMADIQAATARTRPDVVDAVVNKVAAREGNYSAAGRVARLTKRIWND